MMTALTTCNLACDACASCFGGHFTTTNKHTAPAARHCTAPHTLPPVPVIPYGTSVPEHHKHTSLANTVTLPTVSQYRSIPLSITDPPAVILELNSPNCEVDTYS